VDEYILNSRRQSGRQTEKSVLALWKVSSQSFHLFPALILVCQRWLVGALASGTVPDLIVDVDHTIAYLKFAATRNLLSSNGNEQQGNQRLSPVSGHRICHTDRLLIYGQASLKKIMTMLGRVCHRQVDDNPTLAQS
jgi:hypothetical protein